MGRPSDREGGESGRGPKTSNRREAKKKPKGSEEREGGVLGRKGRPSGEKLETKPPTYLDHRFELRAEVRHVERLLVDDVRRRVGARILAVPLEGVWEKEGSGLVRGREGKGTGCRGREGTAPIDPSGRTRSTTSPIVSANRHGLCGVLPKEERASVNLRPQTMQENKTHPAGGTSRPRQSQCRGRGRRRPP